MSTVTEAIITFADCPQCGVLRGQPCITVAPSHRAPKRRYKPGRPTYPHRARRTLYLDALFATSSRLQ